MHRFYAPNSAAVGDPVTLSETEAHHLRDVLRHAAGDQICIFDGEGGEFLCRVESVGKKSAELLLVRKVEPTAPESPLDLTLAAAILKGEKFDLVVKKCVELGVTRLVPLITTRCDVRLKDGERRRERWHKIGIDAARQCGRATLMTIGEPVEFTAFARVNDEEGGLRILFSERNGTSMPGEIAGKKITAFVGPEGGWDDSELEVARGNNISIVTFGGRILRAETASIAIAAILQHSFGDIN